MLEKVESYVYDKYIKKFVVVENGVRKISKEKLESLKLSQPEKSFIMYIIEKKRIKLTDEKITNTNRSPYVLGSEFDNYDCVSAHKKSTLPLSVPADVTLQKIKLYKQNNDQKLREEIITDNMRLVPYVAHKYAISTGINQCELESYGYEGLILALDSFNVTSGNTFSTYAVAYIKGYVLSGIQELLNGKKDDFYYNYINAKAAVESDSGLTLEEAPEIIEDVINMLVATGKIKNDNKAKEYAKRKIVSLAIGNASLDDEEQVEELLSSGELVDTYDYAAIALNNVNHGILLKYLKGILTPLQIEVIKLRFGFYDGIPKSSEEVAKMFGFSIERARNLEGKALERLHISNSFKCLKYEDFETEKYGR